MANLAQLVEKKRNDTDVAYALVAAVMASKDARLVVLQERKKEQEEKKKWRKRETKWRKSRMRIARSPLLSFTSGHLLLSSHIFIYDLAASFFPVLSAACTSIVPAGSS